MPGIEPLAASLQTLRTFPNDFEFNTILAFLIRRLNSIVERYLEKTALCNARNDYFAYSCIPSHIIPNFSDFHVICTRQLLAKTSPVMMNGTGVGTFYYEKFDRPVFLCMV